MRVNRRLQTLASKKRCYSQECLPYWRGKQHKKVNKPKKTNNYKINHSTPACKGWSVESPALGALIKADSAKGRGAEVLHLGCSGNTPVVVNGRGVEPREGATQSPDMQLSR